VQLREIHTNPTEDGDDLVPDSTQTLARVVRAVLERGRGRGPAGVDLNCVERDAGSLDVVAVLASRCAAMRADPTAETRGKI
jgi:hypothetical protein